MDKTRIKILGKKLRETYVAPADLPFPMRKALEALSHRPMTGDNDDLPQMRGDDGEDQASTNAPLSRKQD